MALKIIFERMEGVRTKALVLDKSWTEYISLKNVIEVEKCCWEMVNVNDSKQLPLFCYVGSM